MLSALCTSSCMNLTSVSCRHSFSETVFFLSLELLRLVCSFHCCTSFSDLSCGMPQSEQSRQYRTKPAWRLCTASADEFSVISHRNSLQYASIPASFLCNLTKNSPVHLPHKLCAVLPKNYPVSTENSCTKQLYRIRAILSSIFLNFL